MCMWVRAMHKYYEVSVLVEPKKKLLAEARESLAQTQATLTEAQAKLRAVMDKIAALEKQFANANANKEKLARDVEECRARLVRAHKLVGGLGGERSRWTKSCTELEMVLANLVGDSLVSAATVAYLGPFTPHYRSELVASWRDQLVELSLPRSEGCNVRQTLADSVQLQTWAIHGLPQDAHSIENGIIMSKARRFPLMIDPQGQANIYVKNMGRDTTLAANGLETTKLTDRHFLGILENAVRFGRWVLLESVGEVLDAALEPLLLQQTYVQGGTTMIRLGDSTIPWNDGFRFFMTTTLNNPIYAPEVQVKVTLLNFAITSVGLEDQLLGVTIAEERPDIEEKKSSLVIANANMKRELAEIEDRILYLLSNATGNILDDHVLIQTLASSKATSEDISVKVAETEKTEREIDANRELYRPIAYRAAALYFAVSNLTIVSPMYQYSLQWFTRLFVAAIALADKADTLEQRLRHLEDCFTYHVYVNICRSLFEKTKLLFSFLLAIKVLDTAVNPREWNFLISGKGGDAKSGNTYSAAAPVSDDPAREGDDEFGGRAGFGVATQAVAFAANPAPEWIDARMWADVNALSTLEAFAGITTSFTTHEADWRALYDSTEPQAVVDFPGGWKDRFDDFQRLCILRCLRADKIPEGLMNFVITTLGQRFVESPPFDLADSYADSSAASPLLFLLTKGSDPTKAFNEFCASLQFDKKVHRLSLGQGQGTKAAMLINDASKAGT